MIDVATLVTIIGMAVVTYLTRALGFVLERHLPCYAGNLPDTLLSHILASAKGRYGTTRDYVEQTLSALRTHAMPDRNLEARFKRCHSADKA